MIHHFPRFLLAHVKFICLFKKYYLLGEVKGIMLGKNIFSSLQEYWDLSPKLKHKIGENLGIEG